MEPIQSRQEQVEHDQFVGLGESQAEPSGSVVRGVNPEPFRLEPQAQELEDAGLVLDDQDSHLKPARAYSSVRGL